MAGYRESILVCVCALTKSHLPNVATKVQRMVAVSDEVFLMFYLLRCRMCAVSMDFLPVFVVESRLVGKFLSLSR